MLQDLLFDKGGNGVGCDIVELRSLLFFHNALLLERLKESEDSGSTAVLLRQNLEQVCFAVINQLKSIELDMEWLGQ